MEPPLGSRGCRLVQRRRATRSGGPLVAPNRRAPLIVNRPARRNGDNFRAVRQILLRAQRRSGPGYAMFSRFPSPRPGLGVFRHSRVSGKRSQTLNSLGGNTLWLTRNPLMKSGSGASKRQFGATEPKTSPGTTSPSRVSTKRAINGRVRTASGATICWYLRKWPTSPIRASSSFPRRRAGGRVLVDADLGRGGAGPRRDPILRQGHRLAFIDDLERHLPALAPANCAAVGISVNQQCRSHLCKMYGVGGLPCSTLEP